MHRYEMPEDQFARIAESLPGKPGDPGVTADNRRFVNAVLWIARTGAPWADLPERFGKPNSVWRRFDRWARKGIWARVFDELKDPDLEWLILDSTVIRAHQHAAGKKGGRPTRRWAGRAAASGPSCTSPSTGWATRWSSS
jgi:putative transposase